jgi:hypothetical protein
MPKFNLQRINSITTSIDTVISGFKEKLSSGVAKFKESRLISLDGATTSKDLSIPSGIESPYQAGMPEVFFKSSTGEEKRIDEINYIEIYESMDELYRTGTLTINDKRGFVELTGITNTFEGEYIKVSVRNRFEKGRRTIKFGIYDMVDEPWNNKTIYKLREEPFFTNLNKKVVNKSFSGVRATQIIANILGDDVDVPSLNLIENTQDDPKFPSFICPNWSPEKCIKYLSKYSEQGPIKVFNVSLEEDIVTMIAPLERFMAGQVYNSEFNIFPSDSLTVKNGIRLNKWTLYGPSSNDVKNELSGETIMTFNYFSGDGYREEYKSFGVDDYEFSDVNKKSYATIIGGNFKEGVKKVTDNLGKSLFHKKEKKSTSEHQLCIDVEEKPLVQAKIKSNFIKSFHDEIMLKVVLPPSNNINVGQIFNITLPSEIQPDIGNNVNDSLSGKWLLWKMDHKITPLGTRLKYELHCYFLRTGFSIPLESRNTDKV